MVRGSRAPAFGRGAVNTKAVNTKSGTHNGSRSAVQSIFVPGPLQRGLRDEDHLLSELEVSVMNIIIPEPPACSLQYAFSITDRMRPQPFRIHRQEHDTHIHERAQTSPLILF